MYDVDVIVILKTRIDREISRYAQIKQLIAYNTRRILDFKLVP